jgi:hypothetical protein
MLHFFKTARLVLEHVVYGLHDVFIRRPLHSLYFKGPVIHGYGFWGGILPEDACAVISPGTSAYFWISNMSQCDLILDQRFIAFLTAVEVLTYLFYVYRLIYWFGMRVFIINPVMRRIETILSIDTTSRQLKPTHNKPLGSATSHNDQLDTSSSTITARATKKSILHVFSTHFEKLFK